jgi:integrase
MPRRPKPFFHRGWWKTNVGQPQTKLAKGRENKAAAEDALLDLLNERRQHPDRKPYPQLTVEDIGEKFLDWVQLHRSEDTYDDYRDWLNKWVKLHGPRRVRDIRALDLEEWKQQLAGRGLSHWTVNHAIVAVKTCWSWGFKNDLLPVNPLQKVQKLDVEGRERTFTPEEFLGLLKNTDALFRQVLLFFRLTGIRPGEFCRLNWEQVDFENHILVIRRHKSRRTAKTKKPRIIHLPPAAEKLIRWRLRTCGRMERVFLNERRNPWKVNALRCRMMRLRDRAGIGPDENGERIVMYTARHTFGTRAAAAGVSDRRLADLMGHSDTKMTQKYIHLANPDLRKAALEATEDYLDINRSDGSSS